MMRPTSFLLAMILLPAAAMSQASPARVKLVRCAAASPTPCATVTMELDQQEGAAAAEVNDSTVGAAWRGRLGGVSLAGAGVSSPQSAARGHRLLVLVDRGAAMLGDRITFARVSLKAWLAGLDTTGLRIAVTGFAASDTMHGIDAARFGSMRDAIAAVDQLPPPGPLDSASVAAAIARAINRVERELPRSSATDGGVLVIAADGEDLSVAAGSATAWDGSRPPGSAARRIWVISMGSVGAAGPDRAVAGGATTVLRVATDPNALANALHQVARELSRGRQLTFGLGATEAVALGRTAMTGHVELRQGSTVLAVRRISWRPPLLAMPVFQGVADSNALSPALKEILLVGGNSSMRSLVALLMGLLVISAWLLVPRLGWTEEEIQVKRSHPSSVTRSDTVTSAVVETAPRKPADITQQTARRTAMKR
ncbi:MAG: hypothetical protein ACREK8_08415 [Gemmatimonadales bacterium]